MSVVRKVFTSSYCMNKLRKQKNKRHDTQTYQLHNPTQTQTTQQHSDDTQNESTPVQMYFRQHK